MSVAIVSTLGLNSSLLMPGLVQLFVDAPGGDTLTEEDDEVPHALRPPATTTAAPIATIKRRIELTRPTVVTHGTGELIASADQIPEESWSLPTM